jgi:hypothetical protein
MRHEIKYFIEKTKDEEVIFFVLGNLSEHGIEQIFEFLEKSSEESNLRWNRIYEKMLNESFKGRDL